MKDRLAQLFRSLHTQLFLWAVLPVTFIIIALAFTGVYTHQREMRDFVAERDLALAHLAARLVEDGLAYGAVGADGRGLTAWLSLMVGEQAGTMMVVGRDGQTLAHPDPQQVGAYRGDDPGIAAALEQREGTVIGTDKGDEPVMLSFAPVHGTDWVVLIQEPVEGIIGPILRLSSLAPLVAIGAGVISLLVLTFGWRTIVRPLQDLARAAGKVSWGNYAAITRPVGGVQEVRDLHQSLTDMVERIQGYEAGIRDYLGAVTQGQETERARMARELHDGPVQELIALGQQAEMVQRLVARDESGQAQALLEEMRQAELQTIEGLRRIISALRPVYLEDLGFFPALEMLVRQADERTPVRIQLEEGNTIHRFPSEMELAAYRIAQEALNNVIQHAQARHIVVRVRSTPDNLTLSVTDDGVGFDLPPRPDILTQDGHFGLVGMQERVTRLGGAFQIHTAPGEGTQIIAHLPGQPVTT